MPDFAYIRARTIAEAVEALSADPQARALSGGQTLIPSIKQRLAQPSALVDLGAIAALRGIAREEAHLRVGAGMRHAEVAADAGVRALAPGLAALAGLIGDPQVRNLGTLGGSIATNDPAADYPAACLALDAEIETSARRLPAEAFFTGFFETALAPGEIVTAVRFTCPRAGAYAKHRSPASGYALTGVFVALLEAGPRVAVTGAGPGVFRWAEAERRLAEGFTADALEGLVPPADDFLSDLHASAAYRAQLVAVMARRALAGAIAGSRG
ncbi:MAG: xanthine dehydrogenase family protein subunit M [Alphaproteobacteria bacterium]|nr:xanthine dehydrogenase family protein subunit M [Alphaproteobacteria bacterium]